MLPFLPWTPLLVFADYKPQALGGKLKRRELRAVPAAVYV